jgi:hypothetical protein
MPNQLAPLYLPPVEVITSETPYLALVEQADPDWARYKFWEPEYLTTQRVIWANPYIRGIYNRYSNVYPVGQQYGLLDPLITANLAPTVGNPVPGLYSGIDDGKGWA